MTCTSIYERLGGNEPKYVSKRLTAAVITFCFGGNRFFAQAFAMNPDQHMNNQKNFIPWARAL